jgi:hypothetical protein
MRWLQLKTGRVDIRTALAADIIFLKIRDRYIFEIEKIQNLSYLLFNSLFAFKY